MAKKSPPAPAVKGVRAVADAPHIPGTDEYYFSEQIGHLLRRAYQRHVAIFQAAIPDSDLTAAQFVTLCAVKEKQACSLNDIVKATAIDQATIRGVVERLKARSLIVVSPDPLDGRKLLVRTTEEGLTLIDQSIPFARQVSEQTFGGLNPAERVAIVYLLRAMTRAEES
jgi:DNA-binding MarR family transcriptional regulator